MSESSIGPRTPGSMLREARQAQGVHIAALAASMKVSQRKLEALEADRLDELPDATFTRALAQSVCRSLKIDPAPVLALLPQHSAGQRLEHVSEGINEPFRDRPGRREPTDWSILRAPMAWVVYFLLLASAVVYFLPQRWLSQWQLDQIGSTAGSAASAATESAAAVLSAASLPNAPPPSAVGASATPGIVTETVVLQAASSPEVAASAVAASVPVPAAAQTAAAQTAAASGAGAAATAPLLLVRATAESWVEVRDAGSRVLLGRTVAAGESVALDGATPLRIKVGNAAGTELVFQGQPVNLAAATRDNVARLELK